MTRVKSTVEDDIIVQREFHVQRGKSSTTVTALLRRPTLEPTGEYCCVYELRVGRKILRKSPGIFGVDSMQAVLLALTMAIAELEWIAFDMKGRIEAWQLRDVRPLRRKPKRVRAVAARKR